MSLLENKQAAERAYDQTLANRGLPEVAFIDNKDKVNGPSPVIGVRRGESGCYPIHTPLSAEELNEERGVTPAQCEAMYNGSLFGWETPLADPTNPVVIEMATKKLQKRNDQAAAAVSNG
jgi:hypothetical protein